MSIILITHDLSVVSEFCDKVMVMYAGQIVEYGNLKEILENPKHPYTKKLLRTIPTLDSERKIRNDRRNSAIYHGISV